MLTPTTEQDLTPNAQLAPTPQQGPKLTGLFTQGVGASAGQQNEKIASFFEWMMTAGGIANLDPRQMQEKLAQLGLTPEDLGLANSYFPLRNPDGTGPSATVTKQGATSTYQYTGDAADVRAKFPEHFPRAKKTITADGSVSYHRGHRTVTYGHDSKGKSTYSDNDSAARVSRRYPQPGNYGRQPGGYDPGIASGDAGKALLEFCNKWHLDAREMGGIIHRETNGSMNPDKIGGYGNKYQGLLQFGPAARKDYGFREGMSFREQLFGPAEAYLVHSFKKVGMQLDGAKGENVYAAILAGSPNRVNARDINGSAADAFRSGEMDRRGGQAFSLLGLQASKEGPPTPSEPRRGDLPSLKADGAKLETVQSAKLGAPDTKAPEPAPAKTKEAGAPQPPKSAARLAV